MPIADARAICIHSPMTPGELQGQMNYLGLSSQELERLVARPRGWFNTLLSEDQPAPHWLDLLTLYWVTYPGALDLAREAADALDESGEVPAN